MELARKSEGKHCSLTIPKIVFVILVSITNYLRKINLFSSRLHTTNWSQKLCPAHWGVLDSGLVLGLGLALMAGGAQFVHGKMVKLIVKLVDPE